MAGGKPIFFDRVKIYLDNIPYLPNGMIRSFSMTATYNDTVNQGFSPDGLASGTTQGNKTISSINWTEYLQPLGNYLNLRTFFLGNPNAVVTVVPFSIVTNGPTAPQFTITGMAFKSMDVTAGQEGEPMTRVLSMMAVDSSNT